jgi:hypothetical protein
VKAWRLTAPGGELSFRDVPEAAVTDGSALVRTRWPGWTACRG